MSKQYTIMRKRTICQVITEQYLANSDEEAIALAQEEQNDGGEQECLEWYDLNDVIEYSTVTEDDILEVEDE